MLACVGKVNYFRIKEFYRVVTNQGNGEVKVFFVLHFPPIDEFVLIVKKGFQVTSADWVHFLKTNYVVGFSMVGLSINFCFSEIICLEYHLLINYICQSFDSWP